MLCTSPWITNRFSIFSPTLMIPKENFNENLIIYQLAMTDVGRNWKMRIFSIWKCEKQSTIVESQQWRSIGSILPNNDFTSQRRRSFSIKHKIVSTIWKALKKYLVWLALSLCVVWKSWKEWLAEKSLLNFFISAKQIKSIEHENIYVLRPPIDPVWILHRSCEINIAQVK